MTCHEWCLIVFLMTLELDEVFRSAGMIRTVEKTYRKPQIQRRILRRINKFHSYVKLPGRYCINSLQLIRFSEAFTIYVGIATNIYEQLQARKAPVPG